MKLVILTSNAVRHKYLANTVAQGTNDVFIVAECKSLPKDEDDLNANDLINDHFVKRDKTEKIFFNGNDYFRYPCLPVLHGEVNSLFVYKAIKRFNPGLIIVYGASIIKKPLLDLMPYGRIVNLHLGMSPYYRGSGTNFWPFVNKELQFVGSTLLNIDAGVDTGDIIAHVQPIFQPDDNVHTAGCKVIKESAKALTELVKRIKHGEEIRATKQWKSVPSRYYRKKDFGEESLKAYYANLKGNVVEDYIKSSVEVPDLKKF